MTLGITGRSGCGKSTVTAIFAARDIPLADADQLSREILLPGSPLLPQLAERFGADIIRADGTLDRRLLADRAFATPEGKAALDALTHPEPHPCRKTGRSSCRCEAFRAGRCGHRRHGGRSGVR